MIEYTLTLNSQQAKETLKAVELLMRLKINQPKEVSRNVMADNYWDSTKVDKEKFNDYLNRRDKADYYIELGFQNIFPNWESVKKDDEWYRLYNIYQALRYQIHLAENPHSKGVDSFPPSQFTDEPIPECKWRNTDEDHQTQKRK